MNEQIAYDEELNLESGKVTLATTSEENSQIGVSPNSVWYLMRCAYNKEMEISQALVNDGFEVFNPTHIVVKERNGKKKKNICSLIPNMTFVKTTEEQIKPYLGGLGIAKGINESNPYANFHHYYKIEKATGKRTPLVIPDMQMKAFMDWNKVEDENKLLLSSSLKKFNEGERVLVTKGPFEGFVGYVVRLHGQTRVGINIEGVGAITTSYIPKAFLEKID